MLTEELRERLSEQLRVLHISAGDARFNVEYMSTEVAVPSLEELAEELDCFLTILKVESIIS